ncbi:MAG: hypothetical protein AVDCRST_MAG67-3948 [uncultured Solirubrobacteraceae bacterium]|uniref:GH26 domain-containing protein n=1 Tax=uncultured Solirubrobacteraceae bacterium TaxID=1162706 RepID=A0A6J4TS24_9ACTN|nr:MAG: hypothetical protein AVDCRST_MAG67-3948 [uncultured Solirubrobacteraceae bacterium]
MITPVRMVLVSLPAACCLAAIALPSSEGSRTARGPASLAAASVAAARAPAPARLRFGIYPSGLAGCARRCAPPVAEDAARSLAAVKRLKGDRAFVVHLYGDYTGGSDASAGRLLSDASWWASHGLQVAAILRYRPESRRAAGGYRAWVRAQARRLAALPQTVSIQIANEPTNMARAAGDGSYPGVIEAIATAVPAARNAVVAAGRRDILIGFNWAAGARPATTEPIWRRLRQAGGTPFTRAVGFVAVNVYPGTWSQPWSTSAPTATQIRATMRSTLRAMRSKHMVAAGVSRAAITIGETGYPTTARRTQATQDRVLRAIAAAADAARTTYGVTDLYWFALRDGTSASGHLENGYGLLRDDYSAKPAYATLRSLIARIGA